MEMLENGIRLTTIGDTEALKEPIKGILRETMAKTSQNREMTLNLALSYGGRDEIIAAIQKMVQDVHSGKLPPEEISKDVFSRLSLYRRSARSRPADPDQR